MPAAAAARRQAAAAPGGVRALNPRSAGFGARPHAPSVQGRGEPAAVAAAGEAVNPSHAETLMAEGGDARAGDAADVQARGEPLSPGLVTAGIVPLDIEREMWMSYAAVRQRRSRRLLHTGLAVVRTHFLYCALALLPATLDCSVVSVRDAHRRASAQYLGACAWTRWSARTCAPACTCASTP